MYKFAATLRVINMYLLAAKFIPNLTLASFHSTLRFFASFSHQCLSVVRNVSNCETAITRRRNLARQSVTIGAALRNSLFPDPSLPFCHSVIDFLVIHFVRRHCQPVVPSFFVAIAVHACAVSSCAVSCRIVCLRL